MPRHAGPAFHQTRLGHGIKSRVHLDHLKLLRVPAEPIGRPHFFRIPMLDKSRVRPTGRADENPSSVCRRLLRHTRTNFAERTNANANIQSVIPSAAKNLRSCVVFGGRETMSKPEARRMAPEVGFGLFFPLFRGTQAPFASVIKPTLQLPRIKPTLQLLARSFDLSNQEGSAITRVDSFTAICWQFWSPGGKQRNAFHFRRSASN